MVKIKICGITNVEDALYAVGLGVDALGFVFYPKSPRYIPPQKAADIIRALPSFTSSVGLFVNESQASVDAALACCPLDVLQFHGQESPSFCAQQSRRVIKALAIRQQADLKQISDYACDVLLDAPAPSGVHGGTGLSFDWHLLQDLQSIQALILAGGLKPANVEEAMQIRQWYALDVSSGVELKKGIKSKEKMTAFVHAARRSYGQEYYEPIS
ncbi:MAG: phosphoribosylanthranilate isomerase [Mariprofundaceae bacterium]|nr:phosphoribosylanthranilate isomerase [Mariprofundaceae bacterium]